MRNGKGKAYDVSAFLPASFLPFFRAMDVRVTLFPWSPLPVRDASRGLCSGIETEGRMMLVVVVVMHGGGGSSTSAFIHLYPDFYVYSSVSLSFFLPSLSHATPVRRGHSVGGPKKAPEPTRGGDGGQPLRDWAILYARIRCANLRLAYENARFGRPAASVANSSRGSPMSDAFPTGISSARHVGHILMTHCDHDPEGMAVSPRNSI